MSERRRFNRFRLWMPATIGEGAAQVDAVGHDVSRQGALLVTTVAFEAGANVMVGLSIPPAVDERVVLAARVLRCADNHEDPNGLWPFEVAVEFTDDHPEVEKQLRDLLKKLHVRMS